MSASPQYPEPDSPQTEQPAIPEPTGEEETAPSNIYANIFGDENDNVSNAEGQESRQSPQRDVDADQQGVDQQAGESPADSPDREDMDHDRDDDDDEDRDEDDVFVPGTAERPAKIPKFKKKNRREEDDSDLDEDDEDREERKRKKKEKKEKKRSRRERSQVEGDEEDDSQRIFTAEEERRQRSEERIENIGKKNKVVRRKKKGDDDVDIVDSYHDDVCARLRDRMIAAADKDRQSNDNKSPATAKLAMSDEVMSVLRNTTLWQSIVDNGVLDAVRQWLEPIAPSTALPAVGIQKAIFEILPKMDLDTQTLKECRLGPIVLFYTKTKRVTPAINRQADALVQAWSRPIIKRPANLRSRYVETLDEAVENSQRRDEDVDMEESAAPRSTAPVKRKRFDAQAAIQDNTGKKGARSFINRDVQYTVAPESQLQHRNEDLTHVSRIQMDNRKFNRFARQMKTRGAK